MMKNILVALDNSEFADKVMKQAVDLAKVLGANLTAVSVLDYSVMTYIDEAGVVIMPEVLEGMKKSFELVLNRCRELADNAGLFYKQEILRGSPGNAIVEYAGENGIDLIVVGHIGRTAALQLLLGSVANKVANYGKCSVLVVK